MIKNSGLIISSIILMILTTIFTLRGFNKPNSYISGNRYIDKRYGVMFKFPEGWHPTVNNKEGSNILVVVHKEIWNALTPSANKDKSKFYPYIILVAYNIKGDKSDLSQIAHKMLKADFATIPSYAIYPEVTSERLTKIGSNDAYIVDVEMQHMGGEPIKNNGIFIRRKDILFCLMFSDDASCFEKNIRSFIVAKDSFKSQ